MMIFAARVVLIACALAATALLRHRSAALRHAVLAAAIVCATVTPALERIVPSWSWPSGTTAAVQGAESLTAAIAGRDTVPRQLSEALAVIWLAGAAFGLFGLLVGCARIAWLAARARPVALGQWTEWAEAMAHEYGLSRPVLLLQTDHPTLLVTWGIMRPKVLLPRGASDWTGDRVRIVLAHELAHIRRGDWVVHIAAEILRSVHWFNPLVWIACRRLRQESEHACDDAVLNLGVEGAEYAGHLVEIARAFHTHRRMRGMDLSAPAMARASSLERRIAATLNGGLDRAPISRLGGIATAAAVLGLSVPIAGFGTPAAGSNRGGVSRGWPAILTVRLPAPERSRGTADTTYSLSGMQRNIARQFGLVEQRFTVLGTDAHQRTALMDDLGSQEARDWARGQRVQSPTKVKDLPVRYPSNLRARRIEGRVIVEGQIGTDGFLSRSRVLKPVHPDFAVAVLDTVRQWQWAPTRLGGVPVEVPISMTIDFRLRR